MDIKKLSDHALDVLEKNLSHAIYNIGSYSTSDMRLHDLVIKEMQKREAGEGATDQHGQLLFDFAKGGKV